MVSSFGGEGQVRQYSEGEIAGNFRWNLTLHNLDKNLQTDI